jgi:hypothetical protein
MRRRCSRRLPPRRRSGKSGYVHPAGRRRDGILACRNEALRACRDGQAGSSPGDPAGRDDQACRVGPSPGGRAVAGGPSRDGPACRGDPEFPGDPNPGDQVSGDGSSPDEAVPADNSRQVGCCYRRMPTAAGSEGKWPVSSTGRSRKTLRLTLSLRSEASLSKYLWQKKVSRTGWKRRIPSPCG